MVFPDMRTVYLAGLLMILLAIGVTIPVWRRNRARFSGLGLWVASFFCQGVVVLLVLLRGTITDFFSVLLSGVLTVAGLWLALAGLQRFFGVSDSPEGQRINAILLSAFTVLQGWFLWGYPSLTVRSISIMVFMLAFFGRILFLIFRQIEDDQRRIARPVGVVTSLFAAIAVARLVELAAGDFSRTDFFSSGRVETYTILLMFALFDLLAFSVVHMVNNRLISALSKEEKEVRRLLDEKELILREVHHRVKNNIAVTAGLLRLQSREQLTAEAQEALTSAAERLRGMSILYDRLYRSSRGITLSLKDYLVSIVDDIVAAHPDLEGVTVRTDFEDSELDSRLLSSVGIICCELITNSMKHAFSVFPRQKTRSVNQAGSDAVSGPAPGAGAPPGAGVTPGAGPPPGAGATPGAAQAPSFGPEISLSARVETGRIVILYQDNGRGMQNNGTTDGTMQEVSGGTGEEGFGLTMIRTLVSQLGGTLEMKTSTEGGTQVSLIAPV